MEIFKKIAPIIAIIALSWWALIPLFHQGFYPMHDDEQIARLYDLDQALSEGNFPPRIAPNLGFGYGYPFFNFYPSFAYYVGEIFHLIGFSFIDSTKLMLASGFIFAAIFMYVFVKDVFGKLGGLVSAVVYTYASYHAVDVYVRGAFAEFFAFVFIPLIFWTILKLKDSKNFIYIVIGSLGVGGLVLSHNLIALMSAPFFAIWLFYILSLSKNKIQFIGSSALLFLLGFGLAAYFWLPSYVEREYTIINILTSELANYKIHFVCVHQLWSSPWGYGGSIPSCLDGISFEIGKIQLVLSFIALILASYLLMKGKQKKQSQIVVIFFSYLAIGSFFMVKYSGFIWDAVSPFWYIQFPWRFLLFTSFATAVLSGSIIYYIKNKKYKVFVTFSLIALLIGLNISRFVPAKYIDASDSDYVNKIRWETSSLSYEYVPKGIETKKSKFDTTLIAIDKNEVATSSSYVVSGAMNVETLIELPQQKKFNVVVSKPGILQINTYSFPGWTVFVDGTRAPYADNNKLKLIQVRLDKGSHLVEAKLLDTPIRKTGNITSFISIIVLVVLTVISVSKKKDEKST
jgi:hypothetical protein